ncbi:MAG: sialidase family protein [Lentisphaeria bacterium]|nr:sialidase family protein [Lentisphaeria bacterium]
MIQVQYLGTAPEMTGDVSTGAWANLLWHEQFTPLGRSGTEPMPGTAFAMTHDGDNLYVAVRCSALGGETQEQLARENVQIQLDPERSAERSGIFVCYTDGKASSVIELQDRGHSGGKEVWMGQIGYAAQLKSGAWSMILKVPLGQLVHLEDGLHRIQFNVTRVGNETIPERGLCYPALEDTRFYKPVNAIGEAAFERPDLLEAFAWDVRRAGRGKIDQDLPEAVCRQDVISTNFSTEDRDIDLRAELMQVGKLPSAPVECRLRVGAGKSHTQSIELPVPVGFNYGFVNVSLHEPDTNRCLSENRILVESDPLSWKEHFIKRGDGQGGYTCLAAQQQLLRPYQGRRINPYGLATMDNGEVICAATAWPRAAGQAEQTLITISGDGGTTWGEYIVLHGIHTRPMMLAYLGNGVVTFESGDGCAAIDFPVTTEQLRLFSHDYGRTWEHRIEATPAPDGQKFGFEGNPLVDRDEQGNAIRIAQTGYTLEGAAPYWKLTEYIRWSEDGGRTWPRVDCPEAWRGTETHDGKTYNLSCAEGSLVRATNGWLVAALRTWGPVQLHGHPNFEDSLEGTAVSISRDDGVTWSPYRMVFDSGRHHATLMCMPNGDLVMVVIRRVDFRDGKLASYRRGCDAVVSHDHGETWDIEHMIVLDDYLFCDDERWVRGLCGHLSSTLLPDGSILTGYGNDFTGGVLVRWKP